MSLQYGEADATATPRKLSSCWHTYTGAYPPHVRKHAYSYIHTMHTATFIKEKKTKTSSQQPGTWSHPCTPLLLTALDGETQGSGRTGRRQDLRGDRDSPRSDSQRDRAEAVLLASPPAPAGLRATSLSRTLPTLLRVFCPAAPSVTSPHPSPPGMSRLTYKSTPPLSSRPTSQGQENCRTGPRRPRC